MENRIAPSAQGHMVAAGANYCSETSLGPGVVLGNQHRFGASS